MPNIVFVYVNISLMVLVLFIVQQASTNGSTNEGEVQHLSMENDLDSVTKETISVRRKLRFLGDTPGAIFINTLSVVSSIFTIWSFIETRDDIKEAKHAKGYAHNDESEKIEVLEELIQKLDGLHSVVAQEMASVRHSLKQLICRFDAVHTKTKDINQVCLQFIRPYGQVSTKLSGKNFHRKTNPGDKINTLSKYGDIQRKGHLVNPIH